MGQFVVGVYQGMRLLEKGGRPYSYVLDFLLKDEIMQDIHDGYRLAKDLTTGKSYDLLLMPTSVRFSVEHPQDTKLWTSQVIALDWSLPTATFSRLFQRARPFQDLVLLEAPFGRLFIPFESVRRFAHIERKQIAIGSYISWQKNQWLSLFGIV